MAAIHGWYTERKNVGIVTIFNREGGFSDHSDKESWRLRCVSETLRLVATNAILVIVPCPMSYCKNLYRNERYSIVTVAVVNRRRYDLYCAPRWSKGIPPLRIWLSTCQCDCRSHRRRYGSSDIISSYKVNEMLISAQARSDRVHRVFCESISDETLRFASGWTHIQQNAETIVE